MNYDPQKRPRRQDWEGYYIENGAIYIFSRNSFLELNCRCSHKSTLYEMGKNSLFEIDTLEDIPIVSSIINSNEI